MVSEDEYRVRCRENLERALVAFDEGQPDEGLGFLLKAWETNRSKEIAWVIELVDLSLYGFPVAAMPSAEDLRAADIVRRGQLLRQLRMSCDRDQFEDAQTFLEVLHGFAPDPRVAATLRECEYSIPLAYVALPRDCIDDSPLDLSDPFTALFQRACDRQESWQVAMYKDNSEWEPRLPADLGEEWVARLLDLELSLRAKLYDEPRARQLAAAVLLAPEESAARVAYGEWLTGRNDPRGGLLTGTKTGIGDKELCLGPLYRMANVRFSDGIARFVLFYGRSRHPSTPEGIDWSRLEVGWYPGWAGIEEMRDPPLSLMTTTALPALRTLTCDISLLRSCLDHGVDLSQVTTLATGKKPTRFATSRLQECLSHPILAGVRVLSLHSYSETKDETKFAESLVPLLRDPGNVETVRAHVRFRMWAWVSAVPFLRVLRKSRSPLRSIILKSSGGETWVFGHETSGNDWRKVRVEWWGTPNLHHVGRVERVLQAEHEGAPLAPAITIVAKAQPPDDVLGRIRKLKRVSLEIDPALDLNTA